MKTTFATAITLGFVGLVVPAGFQPAAADPLPYGPDTCINGFVWRAARPGDAVCVTPQTRTQVAQQNADPGAHKDPNGAYGPQSCAQGWVWREAFDGDTICVTPEIRTQTLADNAAAQSRRASDKPQIPSPQAPVPAPAPAANTVVFELTGSGTAGTIDIDDPGSMPRQYNVGLPYSHTTKGAPKSGSLLQIVGVGKDGSNPGCRITVGGNVVASQSAGQSGQCVYVMP